MAGDRSDASFCLIDGSLSILIEFLNLREVNVVAVACSHWRTPARADRIWIRESRSRWQFGDMVGAKAGAAPGARDASCLECWKSSVQQGCEPAALGAFKFYLERCALDGKVAELLELCGKDSARNAAARKQLVALGANALDKLLAVESSASHSTQSIATAVRLEISEGWAIAKWTQLIASPQEASSLEEGALVLAQWAKPNADVSGARKLLESLAARVGELGGNIERNGLELPQRGEAERMIEALNRALFVEHGFAGNTSDYYNPDNSLLPAVLKSKKGIPISLSIIWATVARRQGLQCHLLARFPQHLLIRVPVRGGANGEQSAKNDMFVDAFNHGYMNWEGLKEFVVNMFRQEVPDDVLLSFVDVTPPTSVYARAMRNLLKIYETRADAARMFGILCQLKVLDADSWPNDLERLHRQIGASLGRNGGAT